MKRALGLAVALALVGCDKPETHDEPVEEAADTEAPAEDHGDGEDELAFEEGPEDEHDQNTPEQVREAKTAVTASVAAVRAKMDAEHLAVQASKAQVDAARAELDSELAKIDSLEMRLDERLGIGEIAQQRRKQRIAGLAKMVIAMSPQAAADMLARMPVEDAQDIVLAMAQENQRKASKLLSAMPGDRAAALGKRYLDHDPQTLVKPDAKKRPAKAPAKSPPSEDKSDKDESEDEA